MTTAAKPRKPRPRRGAKSSAPVCGVCSLPEWMHEPSLRQDVYKNQFPPKFVEFCFKYGIIPLLDEYWTKSIPHYYMVHELGFVHGGHSNLSSIDPRDVWLELVKYHQKEFGSLFGTQRFFPHLGQHFYKHYIGPEPKAGIIIPQDSTLMNFFRAALSGNNAIYCYDTTESHTFFEVTYNRFLSTYRGLYPEGHRIKWEDFPYEFPLWPSHDRSDVEFNRFLLPMHILLQRGAHGNKYDTSHDELRDIADKFLADLREAKIELVRWHEKQYDLIYDRYRKLNDMPYEAVQGSLINALGKYNGLSGVREALDSQRDANHIVPLWANSSTNSFVLRTSPEHDFVPSGKHTGMYNSTFASAVGME